MGPQAPDTVRLSGKVSGPGPQLQVYFILLHFYYASQILCFLQIDSLWQPCLNNIDPIFQQHLVTMSLCHICKSLQDLKLVHYCYVYCNWSLMLLGLLWKQRCLAFLEISILSYGVCF